MTQAVFEAFIDALESRFEQFVEQGTDHELFLSGYLHGHFSLVVSEAELAGDFDISSLLKRMQRSLSDAYSNNELCEEDQTLAGNMLDTLWTRSQA